MLLEKLFETLEKQKNEIINIKFIKPNIDFFDFFPQSEKEKILLQNEADKLAHLMLKSERGNYYKFKQPIKTIFGNLEYFKIRWFDDSKINYGGAPDFVIEDMKLFADLYSNDKRFTYTEQTNAPAYKCYKFQTEITWACFMDNSITTEFNAKFK